MRSFEMNTRGTRPASALAFAAAVCVAVVLAGCTVQPTATPTQGPRPTQLPVPPPSSQDEAFAAADAVIKADQVAFYEMFMEQIPLGSTEAFESGNYLELITAFVGQTEGGVMTGDPDTWVSDHTKSTAATLEVDGMSYPYGEVHMVGCIENRSEITYESEPAPSLLGLFFPTEVVVQYDPARQVWLITDQLTLNNYEGTATCELGT